MAIWNFDKHRNWQDWLGMVLGVVIGLSPWLAGQQYSSVILWNAIIIGALVLVLAELELVGLQRWQEIADIACGVWLIASPFIFGYAGAGPLRVWHYVLGAIVVLLAAFELWQDWKLSDKDLLRHGQ
jgi:hypothetical protein